MEDNLRAIGGNFLPFRGAELPVLVSFLARYCHDNRAQLPSLAVSTPTLLFSTSTFSSASVENINIIMSFPQL